MAEDRKNAGSYLKRKKFIYEGRRATFGSWRGDPIVWDILTVSGGHLLLMCCDVVADGPYDPEDDLGTGWSDSLLRAWLNTDFISEAFDEEETAMIDRVETEDGCKDRAFVLSKEEATDRRLIPDDGILKCPESYWLRDTVGYGDKAAVIEKAGFPSWRFKYDGDNGIRPVIWVDLN